MSKGKNIIRGVTGVATGGLSELARAASKNDIARRGLLAAGTGGLSEFAQKNPFGAPIQTNPIRDAVGNILGYSNTSQSSGTPGPFSLDLDQLVGDQERIKALGEKQYQETIGAAPKIVSDTLSQVLPNIAEDYNAGHVLNSSAYPQEVARQASQLTQNLVLPAIQARQGFEQSGLGRGLSMEDFINQANVAKTIGAQAAPQVGNGKGQTGTLLSGIGSVAAPVAKMAMK